MQKLLINGKKELSGKKFQFLDLKMLPYQFLQLLFYPIKVKLTNIPLVQDIFTMIELLKSIGLKINILKKKIFN